MTVGTVGSKISDRLTIIADMCQVVAVECPQGVLLIDAGEEQQVRRARATLEANGLELPRYVLITHDHFDHTEAARHWRDLGAKIVACQLEADRIEDGTASRIACPVDIRLQPDQKLEFLGLPIEALAAPGHTPGSVAYCLTVGGERWLFTGDLVMLDLCPGWLGQFSLSDTLATLEKLARLPVDSIATGHSFDRGNGTRLLTDSLRAASDGTWYRHFIKHRDQFPNGTIPDVPQG